MEYDIFISYRREGGAFYARILKPELEKRGYRVFLDYDELNDGRFDSRIMRAIESAPIFIFILSPGCLDRCVNEDDWVRREIEYAMQTERNIIPVNFDGLFRAFPASLPDEVRNIIGSHQFSKIDSEDLLQESVDKLVRNRIAPIVSPGVKSAAPAVGAEIIIRTDAECSVMCFGEQIAVARPDEKTVINLSKGKYLLEFISTEAPEISEQLKFNVPDNQYTDFIDIKLLDKVLNSITLYPVEKNGLWGYADRHGNLRIPYQFFDASDFSEGLANVQFEEEGLYGFIDKSGRKVIPARFEFEFVGDFHEGLAYFQNENGKYGYMDKTGREVIPCQFKCALDFSEGLAPVKDNGRFRFWGLMEGRWGYINKSSQQVIPYQFEDATTFSEGLAAVKKDDRYGYIDRSGQLVIPYQFESAESFSEGLAAVKKDDLYGYIDRSGQLVIPYQFESAESFSEGLAAVSRSAVSRYRWEYGYIDKSGQLVIPCQFAFAWPFREGRAVVTLKSGEDVLINTAGEVVKPK